MFAAVRKYRVTHIDEVCQKIKDRLEPQLSQQPGFVACFSIQAGNDAVVSINVFESLAQADASNQLAAGFMQEADLGQCLQPPETSIGEIVTSKVKGLPDWVAAILMDNA